LIVTACMKPTVASGYSLAVRAERRCVLAPPAGLEPATFGLEVVSEGFLTWDNKRVTSLSWTFCDMVRQQATGSDSKSGARVARERDESECFSK